MTKRTRNLLDKNVIRDSLTNKRIGNNREVICTDNAIDYVKKQGYIVSKPVDYSLTLMAFILSFIFII